MMKESARLAVPDDSTAHDSSRATASPPEEDLEAYHVLLPLAHRKTGAIPADLLVRHVLSVTREADSRVQRAALEAVLRRCSVGKQDRLELSSAPRSAPFGSYTTRRAGSSNRPYTTLLTSVDPIRGRCDCPDYLRNSLGACKHLLAILDRLAADLPRFERARHAAPPSDWPCQLAWDPVRPLTGDGDWLERLRLTPGWPHQDGEEPAAIGRWFRRDGDRGGRALKDTHAADPLRRLQLIEALLAIAGTNGRAVRKGAAAEPAVRALLRIEAERLRRITQAITRRWVSSALCARSSALSIPTKWRVSPGSWPADACCSPTTWGWERPHRRPRPATSCGRRVRCAAVC